MNNVRISAMISEKLKEELTKEAKELEMSFASYIRMILIERKK